MKGDSDTLIKGNLSVVKSDPLILIKHLNNYFLRNPLYMKCRTKKNVCVLSILGSLLEELVLGARHPGLRYQLLFIIKNKLKGKEAQCFISFVNERG